MKYLKIISFLPILILVNSCNTANPRLTNTHSGKYKVGKTLKSDFLDVQVAVIPVSSPIRVSEKAKTFSDLRDSIPHKYLEILGEKVKTAENLIKYVKEPLNIIPPAFSSILKTDYATQRVRFVIGNIKNYQLLASKKQPEFLHPNTRLETLNTSIDFSASDFEIVSIDKLESEFEEIDLGNLSRTQETNFTSKLTGQYGATSTSGNSALNVSEPANGGEGENNKMSTKGLGASSEIGFNNTETIVEALQVKLKRLKTGFVFNKESITVSQHGANLLDISDNIIVTATIFPKLKAGLKTDVVLFFSNLFKDKVPQNASELTLNRRNIKYMKCEERKVDVSVNSKGLLRTVQNKIQGDNNLEFDDKVIYYPFNLQTKNPNIATISNWTNCTKLYGIEYVDNNGIFYDLMAGFGNTYEAHFVENEREAFSCWLRLQLKKPSIIKLTHPLLELYLIERTSPGQPTKKIKIIDATMTATDIAKIKNLNFRFRIIH